MAAVHIGRDEYGAAVRDAFARQDFTLTPALPRVPGLSMERVRHIATEVSRSMEYLGRNPERFGVEEHLDKATLVGSLLYIAGAPDDDWRPWLSLVAVGHHLEGDVGRARAYGSIAHAWEFVGHLGPPTDDLADRVLAVALGGDAELDGGGDEYDDALVSLAGAIPERDFDAVDSAFETLGESWVDMAIYLHEPLPDIYPQFEPQISALAAVAVRAGYAPDGLSDEVRRLLGPGLEP